MTDQEATDLAILAADCWPNGPKAHIWETDLKPLHFGRARVAIAKTRRTCKFGTAAYVEFVEHYDAIGRGTPNNPDHMCQTCAGSGSIDAPAGTRHNPNTCPQLRNIDPKPCHCSYTVPCRCSDGQRIAATHTYAHLTPETI